VNWKKRFSELFAKIVQREPKPPEEEPTGLEEAQLPPAEELEPEEIVPVEVEPDETTLAEPDVEDVAPEETPEEEPPELVEPEIDEPEIEEHKPDVLKFEEVGELPPDPMDSWEDVDTPPAPQFADDWVDRSHHVAGVGAMGSEIGPDFMMVGGQQDPIVADIEAEGGGDMPWPVADATYKVFQLMADGTYGFDWVRAHA